MWQGRETFPQCFLLEGLRTQTSAAALVRGPRNDYFIEYTYKNILFIFYSFINDSVFVDPLACCCVLTLDNTFTRGGCLIRPGLFDGVAMRQ